MAFTSLDFGSLIKITKYWIDFKSVIATKSLLIQYEQDANAYYIFAIDGEIVYVCYIYKGVVPDPSNYSQAQNTADSTDWATNYQSSAGLKTTESDIVASGNITNTQSITINSNNSGTVNIGITGTWTGTLVFETTLDNTNWISMIAMNVSNSTYVSNTTSNGNFELASAGYQQVRVRGLTVASGTAIIALEASKEIQSVSIQAPLPTGSNTIGTVNIGSLNGLALDATVSTMSGKLPASVGQKTMSASLPITLASDQGPITITGSVGAIIVGYDGVANRNVLTDSTGRLLANISGASISGSGVITNTQTVLSNCASANMLNFVITNTNNLTPWTGTLVFESSVDGTTWVSLNVLNLSTGLLVSSTTTNGNFEVTNNGWVNVRVRGNTVTANSANILIDQSVDSQFVTSSDRSITGTITSNQNVAVNSQGCGVTTIGITGTWTGTLVFETTLDNITWISYSAINISNNLLVSNTTSNGNFELPSGGYQQVRVRGNTVATGTANIALNASSGMTSISIDSPIPTGTNTIGAIIGAGTAGSPQANPVTVQGIAGGTSIPVSLSNTDKTNAGTITTSNGNLAISSQGSSTVVIGITGVWVGTIVFEATVDNTNWIAITSTNVITTVTATSTTSNGTFQISCGGYLQIRARGNTISSGTATVAMDSSTGIQNISIAGAIQVGDFLASGTLGVLGATVIVATSGCSSAVISVTGTWSGIIIPEGQTGDGSWVQVYGWSIDGNSYNNALSSNQHMVVPCGGFSQVRARMQSYTSGTANVSWNSSLGNNVGLTTIINSVPITVVGYGPPGATPYGAPHLTSGVDGGGLTRTILTDTAGHLNIGAGTAGTPVSNVVTVQGISGGTAQPVSQSGTWNIGSITTLPSLPTGANTIGIINQGTAASTANAWTTKITDGTNTSAVKPASTAAIASDPALVVQISPNSPGLNISSPNTSGAGTINGLNAVANISLTNTKTVGFQLAAGTFIGTITAQMSVDGGTTWTNTFFDLGNTSTKQSTITFASANTATMGTLVGIGGAVQARVICTAYTSGSASITLSGAQLNDPSLLCAGPVGVALPPTVMSVGGTDGTLSRIIATDKSGRVLTTTALPASLNQGTVSGFLVQAATTTSQVMDTVYTEQVTNGQRSIKSANAADASAGTGARTIKIIYYDQAMAGPYTETVTLNGTTAVVTVNTNICFIEDMFVMSAGTGSAAAGIISLYANTLGTGTVIGSIAANQIQTNWSHHYVGATVTCNILLSSFANSANTATYTLRSKALAGTFYVPISDTIYQSSTTSSTIRNYTNTLKVVGPARIVAYVTPNAAGSATYYASYDYFDI